MSNFIAQLEALFRYFQINRQVGHTTAMLEGAKNVPCLVLANNQAGKHHLKITGLKEVVTLPEIEGGRLCGLNRPLLIDNAAMTEILGGALHEIEGAKAALLIANRSADDQMQQKRAAESEVIRLKNALTAQSDHWQEIEAIAKEFGLAPDMSLASENLPEGRWSYNDPCSGKLFREDEVADEVIRRIKELCKEHDEARAWVERLQREKQTLTCVYCGKEYPPGSPAHGSAVLTEHIRVCEKHPMRKVEQERTTHLRLLVHAFRHLGAEIERKPLNESAMDGTHALSREIAQALDDAKTP